MSSHVFGLTGGTGAGKTTVATRWRARNLPVVDADVLARDVVAPGTEGLAAIAKEFGAEVLATSGGLDRSVLARLVFGDPSARKRLEAITHPLVAITLTQNLEQLSAAGEPLVCYEAPLLVETGRCEEFRPLVVVTAPEDVQVVRAMRRDGSDEAHVWSRLHSQAPLERKLHVADHVIDNGGSLADTIDRADAILDRICRDLGIDPARYPRPPMDAA